MTKTRLSDFVRVKMKDTGDAILSQRAGTSRGDRFGDSGTVHLDSDEARELYEILDEQFGGDDDGD